MAKDEPYLISPEEAEKMGIDERRTTLSRPSSHSLSREKRRQACASPRTPTTATVVVPEGAGDRGKV